MQITLERPLRGFAWRMPLALYRRLAAVTAFCVWAVIVLGGAVRVTDSGTGCGATWPLCHGSLIPSMEYHELVEWNHRLFATLVGGLMMVTVGSTLLWYRRPRRVMGLALLAGTTYLTQALLGGATVLLHLDHTWVAAHMGNSMILLGSLVLLVTQVYRLPNLPAAAPVRVQPHAKGERLVKPLVMTTLLFTFLAMLSGSAVVGNNADLACPSWPQCSAASILPTNYDAWVSFTHRLTVGASDVLMLALTAVIWHFYRRERRLRTAAHLLALLYVSQVFLGAFTVWLGAPDALRGAHLALAAATWACLVMLAAFVWQGARVMAGDDVSGNGEQTAPPRVRRKSQVVEKLVPEPVRVYFGLIKPRVIPLLLVPTVAAMLMAAVQEPADRPLLPLILLTMLGGTLAAGGAHSINQYLERDIDGLMRRTKRRPVVVGRVAPRNALIFGVVLSVLSFVLLWATVNLISAALALGGNLFYVFVYTVWLKRTTTQNIVIGGAAGAVPPLVGWAAVTGRVDIPALLFFAIIFFWTPAHFWALSLVRQEDYRAANIPMLPVVRGEAYTRASILRYAVLLLIVSLVPFAMQSLGWLYLVAATGLGGLFVLRAVQLLRNASTARAWNLFKFSNIYLALLYLAMVIDRVIALGWRHLV